MDKLKRCVEIYSKYIGYNYTFVLDCNISFTVSFRPEHFHHLIGLHKLKDIREVSKQQGNNAASIFKKINSGKITNSNIVKSIAYSEVEERMDYFQVYDELLRAKVIIDFDYTKARGTKLMSKYILFKKFGDAYAILGLKFDNMKNIYIPETFIVDYQGHYVYKQIVLNIIDIKKNFIKHKHNL